MFAGRAPGPVRGGLAHVLAPPRRAGGPRQLQEDGGGPRLHLDPGRRGEDPPGPAEEVHHLRQREVPPKAAPDGPGEGGQDVL